MIPSKIEEPPLDAIPETTLEDKIQQLARLKAKAVFDENPNFTVLAADTLVAQSNKVFGKPKHLDHAYEMLNQLAGSVHQVLTGVWIYSPSKDQIIEQGFAESTRVWVAPLDPAEIWHYLHTESPMDAAGAYKIQEGFARHIPKIEGSYHNVVGLPIAQVYNALRSMNAI